MYIYSRSAYFVYHILNNFAAQQKKPDFFPPTFLWIIPISLDVVNPPKYKESIFKMKIDNVSVTNSFSNLEWLNFQIEKNCPSFTMPKNIWQELTWSVFLSGIHRVSPMALVVPGVSRSSDSVVRTVDPRGSAGQVLQTDRLEGGGTSLFPGGRVDGRETVSATYQ